MPLSHSDISQALKDMELPFQTDGKNFLHAGPGRYAELISTVITLDDDLLGVTIVATLPVPVTVEKRAAVYELMNLIHGQNIWNFRLHLDEDGRMLTLGKVKVWGNPFDPVQFGDVFFSVVATTDRLYRSLRAITEGKESGAQAFEAFFIEKHGES